MASTKKRRERFASARAHLTPDELIPHQTGVRPGAKWWLHQLNLQNVRGQNFSRRTT